MTPENDHNDAQHEQIACFMGRVTEAIETLKDASLRNSDEHLTIRQDISGLKEKQSFNAGKWTGIGITAGASVTIIGILLKGLSVLKYALGQ